MKAKNGKYVVCDGYNVALFLTYSEHNNASECKYSEENSEQFWMNLASNILEEGEPTGTTPVYNRMPAS